MKYIFEVRIKGDHAADEYAAIWVRASEWIQKAPGAQGTELHRKVGDPGTLLAIARWESKDARDAMEADKDPELVDIIQSASPFVEIRPLGEFEEPQWRVMPPGRC